MATEPFSYSVKLGLSPVLFNWAARARTLFLFLSLRTLSLKTIQGNYSYTGHAIFIPVNTGRKKKK